jgi:glycyl-tRNA synthetase
LPLKKNDERLVAKAKDVYKKLSLSFNVQYDDTGSIGKLYRRQDAIGTPFCVTVDFEALDDDTVTIRERDTLNQERVSIDKLEGIIRDKVDMKQLFV